MKIAILSRNPEIYSTRRIREAGISRGHEVLVVDPTKCNLIMEKGRPSIQYNGEILSDIDAIIPRIGASVTTYGSAVIRHFEAMNVSTSLSSIALLKSRDKLRSLQLISKSGIGIPKSVFSKHSKSDDIESLINIVGGVPIILKLLEGTHGTGVIKVDSIQSAKSSIEAFSGIKKDIIIQEFIEEARGKDIRAFVVDGNVVGSMERSGKEGEFRSNLHKGGTAEVIELTNKEKMLAIEVVKLMGLTVAGVDLIRSEKGLLVLEVNSSPGLMGIEKATGVDIASFIISSIENKVNKKLAKREKAREKKRNKVSRKD